MADKKNPLGAGRKKGQTKEQVDIQKDYDVVQKFIKEKRDFTAMEALSKNELIYHFNRYGLSPFDVARQAFQNTKVTTGFEMVVLGLYKKATEGDMKATEAILKMTGAWVERQDVVSSDGSMTPKHTNINMPINITQDEMDEFLDKAKDLNKEGKL